MKKTYEEPAMEVNLFEQQGDLMQGDPNNLFTTIDNSQEDELGDDNDLSVRDWG